MFSDIKLSARKFPILGYFQYHVQTIDWNRQQDDTRNKANNNQPKE